MISNRILPILPAILLLAAVALFSAACQTAGYDNSPGVAVREIPPDQPGMVAGTGPESQDMIRVTDQMVRSILATPAVARARTTPRVVLLPVENNTRFPINKNIFLIRTKAMLNSRAAGRIKFLAREELDTVQAERDMKRSGELAGNPDRMARAPFGADYFLKGQLDGMGQASAGATSDYILYTFKLIDAETSEEVWEDFAEIKKQGLDDVVYR